MLYFFVKICREEQWANDLLDGKLYANRLSYFKKIEAEEEEDQGDPNEASIIHQRSSIRELVINKRDMTKDVVQIEMQMNWMNHLNLFCIYAGHGGPFQEISIENLQAFREQIELPDKMLRFGSHAVIIRNTVEFIERVEQAIKARNHFLYRGLVRYYDPDVDDVGHDSRNDLLPTLYKSNTFSYQKEYRFVVGTGTVGDDAIIIDIGDIRDIATRIDANQINSKLEVRIQQEEPRPRLFRSKEKLAR